jgi:hypothetical protein
VIVSAAAVTGATSHRIITSAVSQARTLAAVKSLLVFAHRLGDLPFDAGGAGRLPKLTQRPARFGWGLFKYAEAEITARNDIQPRYQSELLTGKISVNEFVLFAEQKLKEAIAKGT